MISMGKALPNFCAAFNVIKDWLLQSPEYCHINTSS
jgi:hypothetical protein